MNIASINSSPFEGAGKGVRDLDVSSSVSAQSSEGENMLGDVNSDDANLGGLRSCITLRYTMTLGMLTGKLHRKRKQQKSPREYEENSRTSKYNETYVFVERS